MNHNKIIEYVFAAIFAENYQWEMFVILSSLL